MITTNINFKQTKQPYLGLSRSLYNSKVLTERDRYDRLSPKILHLIIDYSICNISRRKILLLHSS